MAGGTIYKKQIIESAQQGTGDNLLIIEPNYAYQVPLSFGDNWTKIKLGMYLSYTDISNPNSGQSANGYIDAGGTTNDTFNWIGLVRNANTKSLPLDVVNEGFVGHKSNAVYVTNNSLDDYNKLRIYDASSAYFNDISDANALAVTTFGSSTLDSGIVYEHKANIRWIGTDWGSSSNFDNPGLSGLNAGGTTVGFCSYVGVEFEVVNKGQADQTISMQMFAADTSYTSNLFEDTINPSLTELKSLMNGNDFAPSPQTDITGLVFNNGSTAYDLPDSFYFYNAFTTVRPRIHAWAVKRIS